MLMSDSDRPARHVRGIILIVAALAIATVAIVPALVLATQHGAVPSIRLTRGFDAPPAKYCVVPPCAAVESVVRDLPPSLPVHPASLALAELIPDLSPALSLDPLRGPPASPLA
jgi:hypothetical protein